MFITKNPLEQFAAQLGELAQHQLSDDQDVLKTSKWYYDILDGVLKRNLNFHKSQIPKYLEVACYRHIMGYRLSHERGFEVTLFDICDRDLEQGRELAEEQGYRGNVERVAGDFHSLPFSDKYYDFVYISASIHHTVTPETLIAELMRVLRDDGLFYCQREPAERLFCFYQFTANREQNYTPMEEKLHERGTMRLFSSPFPGARNACVFGRIENDRIPLDRYYEIFANYGEVIEEAVYHEGLLTRLDKEILEKDNLSERELNEYICNQLMHETEIVEKAMTVKDRLLGYSVPSQVSIAAMAHRIAGSLKARPKDKGSMEWRRAMARIFGGSLRFVVKRKWTQLAPSKENKRIPPMSSKPSKSNSIDTITELNKQKFSRSCTEVGTVKLDEMVYEYSGLQFWEKLLPNVQEASADELFASAFAKDDWCYDEDGPFVTMRSRVNQPRLMIDATMASVVAARYRVILDEDLPAANITVTLNGRKVMEEFLPQIEDRMMRIVCGKDASNIILSLSDATGKSVSAASRIIISILQAIPVSRDIIKQIAKDV